MSKLLTAAAGALLGAAMLLLMPTAALADGQGCYGKDQPPECGRQAKPAKPAKTKKSPAAPHTVSGSGTRGPGPGTLVMNLTPAQAEEAQSCGPDEEPDYRDTYGYTSAGKRGYSGTTNAGLRPSCRKKQPPCPAGTALVFRDGNNRVTVAGTAGSTAMCEAASGNASGAPRQPTPPAATTAVAPPPPARPRRPGVWDCFDPVPAREESWLGSIFGSDSNGGKAKTKPKPAAAATGTKRGCNDKGGLTDDSTGARGTGEIPDAAPRPAVATTALSPPPVTATVLPGSDESGTGIGGTRRITHTGDDLCMRPGANGPVPCPPKAEAAGSSYTPTPTVGFQPNSLTARTCWETTGGVRKQVTCRDATGAPISLSPNAQCYQVFTASGNTVGTQPCNAEVLPGEHLRPMDK